MIEVIKHFYQKAFTPTSIASLVYFRILFGLVMLWEVCRYFSYGWIEKYYIRPEFNFTYWGFNWVQPLPGQWMYIVWALLGLLSILIALGLFYRASIVSFFFLFSYVYLIAKSHYLNHFYFIILVSGILIFLSPHKAFSLDTKRGFLKEDKQIPSWQLWLLRFQMGVVYFYGGVAKIDPDWIFGVPLNRWLDRHKDVPFIGDFITNDYTAVALSWSGLFLDLLIVPALLYKRTRVLGYLALFVFHVSNHFLFKIGIFPWFSLGISLLYFSSDFPIRIIEKVKKTKLNWSLPKQKDLKLKSLDKAQKMKAFFITLFVLYNCLMPFRHHFYKGDVHWNETGHSYSWRMKLRNKKTYSTFFYFKNRKTGEKWNEKASKRLSKRQRGIMGGHPEMILQYAHYLRDIYKSQGHSDLRVRVKAMASVNFRERQRLIKKKYNLENSEDCLFCSPDWINPLNENNKRSFSKSYKTFLLKNKL